MPSGVPAYCIQVCVELNKKLSFDHLPFLTSRVVTVLYRSKFSFMYNANFASYLKSHRPYYSVYDGSITAVKKGKYVGTTCRVRKMFWAAVLGKSCLIVTVDDGDRFLNGAQ